MSAFYQLTATDHRGQNREFAEFKGKVLLIVNTASKCGFTNQYEGLEALYQEYQQQGFEVLAFPCNQFGAQEPGSAEEIASFCQLNFNTTFPLFAKIEVNGAAAHPVFQFLKDQAPGILGSKAIKWNFTKFLVDRAGHVVKRFAPNDEPASLAADIEALLAADSDT